MRVRSFNKKDVLRAVNAIAARPVLPLSARRHLPYGWRTSEECVLGDLVFVTKDVDDELLHLESTASTNEALEALVCMYLVEGWRP